jgi:serine/threonine-protein kinase
MDPEAALIGRTIAGRYTIERCIGRGGMASVFAARQDAEPREVAIKIMKRELMKDATVVKRFRREAKAAAMLNHANTVKILDYGVDGEDAYIAMELAKGKDLFQALAEDRPMAQARAALIVAQVGAALSAAHAQGIVHRDLKPENVMLVPSPDAPGGELVKVLDSGIAKILEAPGDAKPVAEGAPRRTETSTNLTRAGTVVGTPAYMSPEQCRGGQLDGRSDVYSAGVLLYQLVTGQLPFMGETPLHTAMRHIHAPPRPPSEIRAGLDPTLESIVLKALAKWPAERQQSADELRAELLAVVDALPDRVRGPGGEPRREPDDDIETGQREQPPRTAVPASPRAIQRQPTEAQVGMRLGGGLGKLVSPVAAAARPGAAPAAPVSPPPPPTSPADDDELERSETPARIVDPPERGAAAAARPGATAARPKWGDDDEATRLRTTGAHGGLGPGPEARAGARAAPGPADDDDDDGPRTALMTSDAAPARTRVNRTLLMADESSTAGEPPPSRPHIAALTAEPSIRSTVRLGSPAPVTAPSPPRKDVTAAAFARTQNAGAMAAALLEEESKPGAVGAEGGLYAQIKATMRIVDETSSVGTSPGLGPGMIAPPLAPPPPPPRPLGPALDARPSMPGERRDGLRGSLEQLPGTTVLVVGVALGVVFSAAVILVIVLLARG